MGARNESSPHFPWISSCNGISLKVWLVVLPATQRKLLQSVGEWSQTEKEGELRVGNKESFAASRESLVPSMLEVHPWISQ